MQQGEEKIHPQSVDAYYGQGPLLQLGQNVCVVGHRGSRPDKVVRYLGALLGLHYVILDEMVAHDLGESALGFIGREGLACYRHLEAKQLRKAVRAKPCGLIAVSSDALTGMWTNYWVRKKTKTLWLEMGFDLLLANAKADRNVYPGLPAFLTEARFRAHLENTWDGQNADLVLDLFNSEPSLVAGQVMRAMGWSIR